MTAFGLKQHGEEGLAGGNPFGKLVRLVNLNPLLTLRRRAYWPPEGYGRSWYVAFRYLQGTVLTCTPLEALFLASPAGAYVSGTHILLDGADMHSRVKPSL